MEEAIGQIVGIESTSGNRRKLQLSLANGNKLWLSEFKNDHGQWNTNPQMDSWVKASFSVTEKNGTTYRNLKGLEPAEKPLNAQPSQSASGGSGEGEDVRGERIARMNALTNATNLFLGMLEKRDVNPAPSDAVPAVVLMAEKFTEWILGEKNDLDS